jgi:hypothetical protein
MMGNCTFRACALFMMLQWHTQTSDCAKLPSCLYIAGERVILCIIHWYAWYACACAREEACGAASSNE